MGLVSHILDELPIADMQPDRECFLAPRCLGIPGRLQVVYSEFGELITAPGAAAPMEVPHC
ncbi:MAG: hypothetical protein M3069_11330 [Chloroflexota bacterium]|nr:hypothetical protein [Chloroflexota bacterium]